MKKGMSGSFLAARAFVLMPHLPAIIDALLVPLRRMLRRRHPPRLLSPLLRPCLHPTNSPLIPPNPSHQSRHLTTTEMRLSTRPHVELFLLHLKSLSALNLSQPGHDVILPLLRLPVRDCEPPPRIRKILASLTLSTSPLQTHRRQSRTSRRLRSWYLNLPRRREDGRLRKKQRRSTAPEYQ